ncbi:MAG: 2-C-methyl-D-erythritol 4-phosphate cytidylyltransferase [Dehalococcoidia bacterium]|jgi:2-C-methyl-D-erythritol 4-phosphate cytidylyltransferase/2C-methyl-D-erythritol 2,4-cyclodiphosphate synthase
MEKVGAIIVAAGKSERMGGVEKIFATIDGRPLLYHAVEAFQHSPIIDNIVLVMAIDNIKAGLDLKKKYRWSKVTAVCAGGARRQDSVSEGLNRLGKVDWVLIHDGARPCITQDIIERGLEAVRESGAAIPAMPATDTIKIVSTNSYVKDTPPRDKLWAVQTPQVFRFDIIAEAHRKAKSNVTDDAAMVESLGHKVKIFKGSYTNIKVTTPEDLIIAEAVIKSRGTGVNLRTGIGFDMHPLVEGRRLVLGGVTLKFERGLQGHSDADVLVHAIIDALLGASALGDIGKHFPDTDAEYKDISSIKLLERIRILLNDNRVTVENIDSTIICEKPRLATHTQKMCRNIAKALEIDEEQVSVKASTTNSLGLIAKGEGIAAMAVVLIKKD